MSETMEREAPDWDLGVVALEIGGEAFSLAALVLAAIVQGAWMPFERAVAEGLAAERAGVAVDEEQVEAATEAHRRHRRLLAADDLRAWLAERDLDVRTWRTVLRRRAQRLAAPEPPDTSGITTGSIAAVLRDEALIEGILDATATRLTQHAFAAEELGEAAPAPAPAAVADVVATARAAGAAHLLDPAVIEPEARRLVGLAAAFDAYRRAWPEPKIAAILRDRRLDWLAVSWREAPFSAEDAAREALLCVTEDGEDLEALTARVGVPLREHEAVLGQMEQPLSSLLAAAQKGEAVGPAELSDDWCAIHVVDRRVPALAEPDAVERARDELTEGALRRRAAGRVVRHGAL